MTMHTMPEPRPQGADPLELPDRYPPSPAIAVLIACAFQRLGGHLTITSRGERMRGRPCSGAYCSGAELPQLPGVEPWERFHSPKEWEGAIKLLDYFLTRLDSRDKDLIFDGFVEAAVEIEEARS